MERIGIDIGGTKIDLARVDDKGAVLAHHRVPTNAQDGISAVVSQIAEGISALGGEKNIPVGVGCAGVIDEGVIQYAGNLGWRDVPLQTLLAEKLNRRVVVENDVRAALIGETRYGVARDVADVIYLAIGTGLGAAAVVDGRLLRGSRGMAMELGYVKSADGTLYEHGASGTGLGMIAKSLGMTDNTHRIIELWRTGDETATRAVNTLIENIGVACAWTCSILTPRMVVLGGGMGLALGEKLADDVKKIIAIRCADFVTDGLSVHLAKVTNNAVGAAALV